MCHSSELPEDVFAELGNVVVADVEHLKKNILINPHNSPMFLQNIVREIQSWITMQVMQVKYFSHHKYSLKCFSLNSRRDCKLGTFSDTSSVRSQMIRKIFIIPTLFSTIISVSWVKFMSLFKL